jgi:hypothetical protein
MLKKLSIMFSRWRCNIWRCILEHPAEEHFQPLRSRCNLASPVEKISSPRSFYLYSAVAAPFAAPKYTATVGDALTLTLLPLNRFYTVWRIDFSPLTRKAIQRICSLLADTFIPLAISKAWHKHTADCM